MNFASRFKNIFFNYSLLFSELKEEGIGRSLLFYWLFAFVLFLVSWVLLNYGFVPANILILKQVQLTPGLIMQATVYSLILYMLAIFVLAGYASGFSRLFGQKSGVSGNIKVFSHSLVPLMLTAWISSFNAIFGLWYVYLATRGIQETNDIGFRKSFYIVASATVLTLAFVASMLLVIGGGLGLDLDLNRMLLSRS